MAARRNILKEVNRALRAVGVSDYEVRDLGPGTLGIQRWNRLPLSTNALDAIRAHKARKIEGPGREGVYRIR